MSERLLEQVGDVAALVPMAPAQRRLALRSLLRDKVDTDALAGSVARLSDWIDGYGPLTDLMSDPAVTDILVNDFDDIWAERDGILTKVAARFEDERELMDLIERLAGEAGVRVDMAKPIGDGRLADGSRLHLVLPPVSDGGPLVSIRRFPEMPFDLDDLIARSFVTDAEVDRLRDMVLARRNIVISGATGAGKTTLACALLGCVPDNERVLIVEETPELRPRCAHSVSLSTRAANVEGRGEIDQQALLRTALRMRPDRIVVGEVRGPEAVVALQAMSTGHEGSLVTVHARSAGDAEDRLIDLAMQSPGSPNELSLRRMAERALDVFVHVGRRDGKRKVLEIVSADG